MNIQLPTFVLLYNNWSLTNLYHVCVCLFKPPAINSGFVYKFKPGVFHFLVGIHGGRSITMKFKVYKFKPGVFHFLVGIHGGRSITMK